MWVRRFYGCMYIMFCEQCINRFGECYKANVLMDEFLSIEYDVEYNVVVSQRFSSIYGYLIINQILMLIVYYIFISSYVQGSKKEGEGVGSLVRSRRNQCFILRLA